MTTSGDGMELRHRNNAAPGRRDSLLASSDEDDDADLQDLVKDIENDPHYNEKEPDTKWQKVKACMKEWGETTSAHGIPHMAMASTLFACIVWGVILVFCAIAFIYLCADTIMQYLSWGKIVTLELGLEDGDFPSITFCNTNPYKLSMMSGVPELKALLTVYESAAAGNLK